MHEANADGSISFACDFCGRAWDGAGPMVEGHRGSLICGDCLRVAFSEVVLLEGGEPSPEPCVMCLEVRKDRVWASPAREDVRICRRCANQSARVLAKDKEMGWALPQGPAKPAGGA